MGINPEDIKWSLHSTNVVNINKKIKAQLGNKFQETIVNPLRITLCNYFNSGNKDCLEKQGKTISPFGRHVSGAKQFKVRCPLPGTGKSGGLRLAVVVYCKEKVVKIAGAWIRRDDPSDEEFDRAFKECE